VRYRKVSTAYWADEKVRPFTADNHTAFLRILTGPEMTSVGAMRGTLAGIAAELGWSVRRIGRALAPAIEAGMVEVNEAACFIALPRFLRHNPPESPNVCKAWVTAVAGLPECPGRDAVVTRCREYLRESPPFLKAFEEAYAKAFGEAFRHPLPNQEQEPEPEQEQRAGEGAHTPPSIRSLDKTNGHSPHNVNDPWAGKTQAREVKL
jgi:hypothetical protein